jgi:hypothetical protein
MPQASWRAAVRYGNQYGDQEGGHHTRPRQLDRIRALVDAGTAPSVFGFVRQLAEREVLACADAEHMLSIISNTIARSSAARSRGEPRRARRATRGYLAATPFFVAGTPFLPAVSGALAFRMSSANFRWLASNCSAKS